MSFYKLPKHPPFFQMGDMEDHQELKDYWEYASDEQKVDLIIEAYIFLQADSKKIRHKTFQ